MESTAPSPAVVQVQGGRQAHEVLADKLIKLSRSISAYSPAARSQLLVSAAGYLRAYVPPAVRVSRERYVQAVMCINDFLHDLAISESWCGERHDAFRTILPGYVNPGYDTGQSKRKGSIDFFVIPAPEGGYEQELLVIRQRIMHYVDNHYAGLRLDVDKLFALAGIPDTQKEIARIYDQQFSCWHCG